MGTITEEGARLLLTAIALQAAKDVVDMAKNLKEGTERFPWRCHEIDLATAVWFFRSSQSPGRRWEDPVSRRMVQSRWFQRDLERVEKYLVEQRHIDMNSVYGRKLRHRAGVA